MDARFETDSSSIFYFTSLLADVARLPRNFKFSMRTALGLSLLLLRVSQILRLLVINIIITPKASRRRLEYGCQMAIARF